MSRNGRLHQKLVKILPEHFDGSVLRLLGQLAADLPLDRRGDQPVIAVLHGIFQNRCGIGIIPGDCLPLKVTDDLIIRRLHLYSEKFLLLSAVQCQDTVSRKFRRRLLKFIIHLINRLRLRILCRRDNLSLLHGRPADPTSIIRIVGNGLCDNILRTGDSVRRGFHILLLRNICFRRFLKRLLRILQHDQRSKRLQPLLLRNGSTGPPLRTVRTVQIFHRHLCLGCKDLRTQLFCHLPLLLDTGNHLFLLLLQIAQIDQSLIQLPELFIVKRTCRLLPVS